MLVVEVAGNGRHLVAETGFHHPGEGHPEVAEQPYGVRIAFQHQQVAVHQGDGGAPAVVLGKRTKRGEEAVLKDENSSYINLCV